MFKPKSNQILNEIRQGNDEVIASIYQKYRDEFTLWAYKNFKLDNDSARDLFQDSVIDFYQNVREGKLTELTSSLKTYLFQIGKHKILNFQNKQSRTTYQDSFDYIKGKEHEAYMNQEDLDYNKEQLTKALNELPEDCKKVLELYYFKQYDMESIAEEMGYKNAQTAKSKKLVCMKKLTAELKKISLLLVL